MKNKVCIVAALVCMMLATTVSAAGAGAGMYFKTTLHKKDPSTWNVISNHGYTMGYQVKSVTWEVPKRYAQPHTKPDPEMKDVLIVKAWDVTPNTQYTLIYYGDNDNNDLWPYASCLVTVTSNRKGRIYVKKISTGIFSQYLDPATGQKFWLVPTNQLDCSDGKFISWNPELIYFEGRTV